MDRIKVGLLGGTGVVGQVFARMLANHPFLELSSVYASDRSSGSRYSSFLSDDLGSLYEHIMVERADSATILAGKNDIIFSAVSDSAAGTIEKEISAQGVKVFTNASANRMDPSVPLVVPEINFSSLEGLDQNSGFIVANGNCSTIGLSLGVAPLSGFGIKKIDVTTMQAVSGAGYPGVPSLDILSNVVPFIQSEEEKISRESAKIFGNPRMEVNATCTRVPIRDGHLESVTVVLEDQVDKADVLKAYHNFGNGAIRGAYPTLPSKSVIVRQERDRPQPLLDVMAGTPDRAKGMAVTVGRIRQKGNAISLVLLVHNLIRGAAGSAILNAEVMHGRGAF